MVWACGDLYWFVLICAFWLANVLLAAAPCNFSIFFHIPTSKSGLRPSVFSILTSKCASRYSGVQFFYIFLVSSRQLPPHLPLYRGYFSTKPTHNSLKNTTCRDFSNNSRLWIFFLAALFCQLSILSEVRLLNFRRWYLMIFDICFYSVYPHWPSLTYTVCKECWQMQFDFTWQQIITASGIPHCLG